MKGLLNPLIQVRGGGMLEVEPEPQLSYIAVNPSAVIDP
jgi:hypothetical protein